MSLRWLAREERILNRETEKGSFCGIIEPLLLDHDDMQRGRNDLLLNKGWNHQLHPRNRKPTRRTLPTMKLPRARKAVATAAAAARRRRIRSWTRKW
jgi:hypothetical protein